MQRTINTDIIREPLKATRSQWETFFSSLIWDDICNNILVNDYGMGTDELLNPDAIDLNKVQFNRGRLSYIKEMMDLPATVSLLLTEEAEDKADRKEGREEELDEDGD